MQQLTLDARFTDLQRICKSKQVKYLYQLITPDDKRYILTIAELQSATGWTNRGSVYRRLPRAGASWERGGYKITAINADDAAANKRADK